MMCEKCDRGWHCYCLDTPLETVPRRKGSLALEEKERLVLLDHTTHSYRLPLFLLSMIR